MKFALLYRYDPTKTGPGGASEVEEWLAYDKQVRDAGIFVYEAGFHAVREAGDAGRTVSVRDGSATVTDGIAGRVDDVMAGLYVLDVADLEAATVWAERIPTARYGTVEIRRVVE